MKYKTIFNAPAPTTELENIILEQNITLFEEWMLKLGNGSIVDDMGAYNLNELLTVGFFRALQVNNQDMALRLLTLEQTKIGLTQLQVQTTEQRLEKNERELLVNRSNRDKLSVKLIKKWSYIDFLSSYLENYPGMKVTNGAKNVALLTLTILGYPDMLVNLLEIKEIKAQLSHTCIPLFMNMILDSSGAALTLDELDSWQKIRISKLMEYPLLFAYISARWFDFADIIEQYQEETLHLLSTKMTEEQLTSFSTYDIQQAFYILKNLIQHRLIDNLDRINDNETSVLGHIMTLLNIPALCDIAHKPVCFENDKDENYLLRLLSEAIINNQTRPDVQKKLIEVATYLMTRCKKVRILANIDDFYSNDHLKNALPHFFPVVETLSSNLSQITLTTASESSPIPMLPSNVSLPSLANLSFLSNITSPTTVPTEVTTRENSPAPNSIMYHG